MRKYGLLLCLLAGCALANPKGPQVHEFKLDNGLKIVVREDHRSPVVISQIWYKIGSAHETGGTTGISHVLEHMMFKGTKQNPGIEFSRQIAADGGQENAFTGDDYTAYFQKMAASRLATSFRLEADRMRNLDLKQKEFTKELSVVKEERRMRIEDNPNALLGERFNAIAHYTAPYHNPIVGWMSDLNSLTLADVKAWYEKWYSPNNATIVVVGDVDPKHVLALANKYFGKLKPSNIDANKPHFSPRSLGQRRIILKAPAKLSLLKLGYNTPSLNTIKNRQEAYALEVAAAILTTGESSRLSRDLVRNTQVAVTASASYDLLSLYPGLFQLQAIPSKNYNVKDVEKALLAEVKKLQEQPVTTEELKRVKAQVIAQKVFAKDSVFGQAMAIGMYETVGLPWQLSEKYADDVQRVTATEIQAAARKYLIPQRLTVGILEPTALKSN